MLAKTWSNPLYSRNEVREEVGETPDENLEAAVSDCDDFEETEDEGMAISM